MTDPRVPLKNPFLAAFLAFLVPGLGHAYQGRFFKASLYAVCILGTFFAGMALGDWQPVYFRWDQEHARYSYFSQAMVGAPALPALVQSSRYLRECDLGERPGLDGETLTAELSDAVVRSLSVEQRFESGSVDLTQTSDQVSGEFNGTSLGGQPVRYQLAGPVNLQQKVYPAKERTFECRVVDADGEEKGRLTGQIPRAFWDWCQVPLGGPDPKNKGQFDNSPLASVHGRLGKRFDLASVFTWIAGLLNVLAIWDAFEGPAYGYGDEQQQVRSDNDGEEEATE